MKYGILPKIFDPTDDLKQNISPKFDAKILAKRDGVKYGLLPKISRKSDFVKETRTEVRPFLSKGICHSETD